MNYLVMKAEQTDRRECSLKAPAAFVASISEDFKKMLNQFASASTRFLNMTGGDGCPRTELENYSGDWMFCRDDLQDAMQAYWRKHPEGHTIEERVPAFLLGEDELDEDPGIDSQHLYCDGRGLVYFGAGLGGSRVLTHVLAVDAFNQETGEVMKQADYLADPTLCPGCGAESCALDEDTLEMSEDLQVISVQAVCKSCGRSWETLLKVCGYANLHFEA